MSTSTVPLFGQAWELIVTYATKGKKAEQVTISYTNWDTEALRITFEVSQSTTDPFWYADIKIYNMNEATVQNILYNATWAELKAGFMSGPSMYSTIWNGPVFQTTFTRESVVDQAIGLHCIANPFVMDSIVSFATGEFTTQLQLVGKAASQISLPPLDSAHGTVGHTASKRLEAVIYPRGNACFGKISTYLSQIADTHFLQTWKDGQQAYISEATNGDLTPTYTYSPPFPPAYSDTFLELTPGTMRSLIGTPRQIQQGVLFEVLLDPRIRVSIPPLVLQIERTQVAQLTQTPSPAGGQLPTALSANLACLVSKVRHVGDSRGNEWYTEVTGYSTTYAETLLNLGA